ncbi:MAG: efflux RND transporter permease subunit [Acidobacteriota bacterium]
MNLTRLCLENRTATAVFLTLLFLTGLVTYRTLPRAEDPGFKIRAAIVTTFLPGAGPDDIELLVTDTLEKAIEELPELHFMTSESRTGASVIVVNFGEEYRDLAPLFRDLREKVRDVRGELPADIVGPFINDDFGDVFGTVLALTGEGFSIVEIERAAERVRRDLLLLDDVAKVEIFGAQEERIFVEFDEARLAQVGLGPQQLAAALQQRNILQPGGDVRTARERFELEVSGRFDSVETLADTVLRTPDGALLALRDVAEVRRGTVDPPEVVTRYGGWDDENRDAVVLAVSMQANGKITELGPKILERMESLESRLPLGLEYHVVSYQTTQVDKSVDNFVSSLLQGVAVVLLVMLITLGIRTGLIVAAMIPMAMVGSLVFMAVFGITLNKMSLAALIISLGLLVDSAIVMAESILVAMREGRKPLDAALDSARELRLPLLVSSLTTAAALLPTYLAESTTGEYTSAIFEVVTISLLLAWVLSLTMTPMLSLRFGVPKGSAGAGGPGLYDRPFYRWYQRRLEGLLRRPWLSLAGFVAVLATAMWAFQFVPQQFFPRKDQTTFQIALETPYGSPIQYTQEVVEDVENFLQNELKAQLATTEDRAWLPNTDRGFDREGVVNWASFIGSGAPRFVLSYDPEQPRPNYAFLIANSSSYEAQEELIPQVERYVRQRWPDVLPRVQKLRNGPPLVYPIEVRVSGDELNPLFETVRQVEERLRQQPGLVNVGNDWGRWTKKVRVQVDDARARGLGLTSQDTAFSLQTATSGSVLTQYREGNDLIPVVLRSNASRMDGTDQLQGLEVTVPASGERIPLEQIASLAVDFEPSKVLRRDRQRTVTIFADLDPQAPREITPFSIVAELVPWLETEAKRWPLGTRYELGGEIESSGDAQASIQAKQPIALIVILSLLVLQFNSLREPIIVLLTLPFTLVGVMLGMLITQTPFGFMPLLGVIALIGVVINNAVVLLDRIRIERDQGLAAIDAVLTASQRRLRPILLTTATTVGGLIPLWLAGGPMFSPMAIALLSGLVVSTILTLGLVPVLYALFFRIRFRSA